MSFQRLIEIGPKESIRKETCRIRIFLRAHVDVPLIPEHIGARSKLEALELVIFAKGMSDFPKGWASEDLSNSAR